MDSYEPKQPHLCRVWEKLSLARQRSRLSEARRKESILKTIADRAPGVSERMAIGRLASGQDRSSFRRWQKKYREHGLEGLIDSRLPPPRESMPALAREAICTLRRADPDCAVTTIVAHVAKHHGHSVSQTKVKEVLVEAGLARRRGTPSRNAHAGEIRLELAGMKLLEAASVQTGYVAGLAMSVDLARGAAPSPTAEAGEVDTSGRDEAGRFESNYNERNRKKPGDVIGPGFASVEVKRATKDPSRFHLQKVGIANLERKIWALMVSPLLGGGRWDGIRVARGQLLDELCGYAYMPSTLDLFTRELKFLGMSSTWWEIHARRWLSLSRNWGNPCMAAVLYVDDTTKPVWTELFSQSSKVSQNGRVMPALEVVAFHSGYGVPLWQVTRSGRAPLVREVPELLERFDEMHDTEIGRLVVIDSEGNSIPFLKGLEAGPRPRGWVTRLRPSLVNGKLISDWTEPRPYRDGDLIRMGVGEFHDPAEDSETGIFPMLVIEIERRSKKTKTYLGASLRLPRADWSPESLADIYFDRWPNQEANFRAVNQAVGSKEVHGYGKQLVDNVSVLTEMDKLQNDVARLEGALETLQEKQVIAGRESKAEQDALRRSERRLEVVERAIDSTIAEGKQITPKLQELSIERRSLEKDIERGLVVEKRRKKLLAEGSGRIEATQGRIEEKQARRESLESRRQIFRHDVELDALFSVLKVGLVLLVTYVLKEYLGNARMEPATFLERLATLPGRMRMTPDLEIVTFDYNTRDPEIMALISTHAEKINALRLPTRSGRILRIAVDPAPIPRRPTPPNARANTERRFAR